MCWSRELALHRTRLSLRSWDRICRPGCANAHNLQRMAERQSDLVRGRPLGAAPAAPTARAAQEYIYGMPRGTLGGGLPRLPGTTPQGAGTESATEKPAGDEVSVLHRLGGGGRATSILRCSIDAASPTTKDRAMSIGFRLASCAVPTLLGFLLAGCASQALLDAAASTETKPDQDGLMRVASDVEAQGQIVAALPIYEQAAAASSGDATAQVRLGDAYTRAGKTDQAIQAYRAALAVAPDNPDALLGLGSALVKAGDADGAVVALAKAAPIINTMTAYNRLGVAQTLDGPVRASAPIIRRCERSRP